jgi:hypothetical protein
VLLSSALAANIERPRWRLIVARGTVKRFNSQIDLEPAELLSPAIEGYLAHADLADRIRQLAVAVMDSRAASCLSNNRYGGPRKQFSMFVDLKPSRQQHYQ